MKTKNCKVDLVADSMKQLGNWIEAIDEQYLRVLLNYQESATYQAGQEKFTGRITGVDIFGHLMMQIDGKIKTFDMKEIVFLF